MRDAEVALEYERLCRYTMMPDAVSLSQQIAQVGQCAQHLKGLVIG